MPTIYLSPGRGDDLKLDEAKVNARVQTLEKKLGKPIAELSSIVAEGFGMANGLEFTSGAELAYHLNSIIKFSIAALMEQGHLQKTLPKSKPEPEASYGQYV